MAVRRLEIELESQRNFRMPVGIPFEEHEALKQVLGFFMFVRLPLGRREVQVATSNMKSFLGGAGHHMFDDSIPRLPPHHISGVPQHSKNA